MSADFLLKVANVIEEAAKVLDAHEAEKLAAVTKAREETAKAVASKYALATGEELPADVMAKLASSDETVLATVSKLLDKKAEEGGVERMGGSGDKSASVVPVTKDEKAKAAWDNFGNYINS